MNTFNKNIIPGAILVGIGLLFLAGNFDWFDFNWHAIGRLWPVLLILLGVNKVFGKGSSLATTVTIVLLAVTVPLTLLRGVSDRWHNKIDYFDNDNDNDSSHDDGDSDDNSDDDNNSDDNDNDDNSNDSNIEKKQSFSEPLDVAVKTATLHLTGGAAKFEVNGGSSQLIDASAAIKGNFPEFVLNKVINGANADVEIQPKNGKNGNNFDFGDDDDNDISMKNNLKVNLNNNTEWTLDVEFGAGKADLDLSELNIKKLSLKSGVASSEIKLGGRAILSEVKVESGVASVEISVPESAGCRIDTKNEALNVKDFDGFVKNGSIYQTPNYDKATKKININFESGMSKLKVTRY